MPPFASLRFRLPKPSQPIQSPPTSSTKPWPGKFSQGVSIEPSRLTLCCISDKLIRLPFHLQNSQHVAVIDTGATQSCVGSTIAEKYPSTLHKVANARLKLGNGVVVDVTHAAFLQFNVGPITANHSFWVLPSLPVDCLVGLDLLAAHNVLVDTANRQLCRSSAAATHPPILLASSAEANKLGQMLAGDQVRSLTVLLDSFNDIFATDQKPFGTTHLAAHAIDTGTAYPIHQGLRPTSPHDRQVIREEVANMLEAGAIQPSIAPWASPMVLITKKAGEVRFCVDFRRINDKTTKDVIYIHCSHSMCSAE